MDRQLIGILLLLGLLVQLISLGTPTLAAPSGYTLDRDECLREVASFFGQLDIDEDVRALVEDARQYYERKLIAYKQHLPEYTSAGCLKLHNDMQNLKNTVPCYYDARVVGRNETKNILDVINCNDLTKYAVEAEFACAAGRLAGRELRNHGLYEAITSHA